ncbi:hypothetical protein [Opitutus terrae]|uniref:hypothetical protein n=1 Tax=Opitutus terrae TaxID=107709 RepID=UPI001ED95D6D|nr:hypothetical protein [Opitutus terrae]
MPLFFAVSQLIAVEIDPIGAGPFAVASTNLEVNAPAPDVPMVDAARHRRQRSWMTHGNIKPQIARPGVADSVRGCPLLTLSRAPHGSRCQPFGCGTRFRRAGGVHGLVSKLA